MISSLKVTRQMSHQDRRAMMTPKRKCSFSSFSECRYVVDGGKTTTFLFAIETPSPSSHDNDQQTNCKQYHIFMLFFDHIVYKNKCFVHPIFSSVGFWYFGHYSFFPSCPTCLAICKQILSNDFGFL